MVEKWFISIGILPIHIPQPLNQVVFLLVHIVVQVEINSPTFRALRVEHLNLKFIEFSHWQEGIEYEKLIIKDILALILEHNCYEVNE